MLLLNVRRKSLDDEMHEHSKRLKLKRTLSWSGESCVRVFYVMEFAWKDQNVVLFMSTVSTTDTNSRTSRAVFGDNTIEEPAVPWAELINSALFDTQRTHNKT